MKFKAMKFWIGDDPKLSAKIQQLLGEMGYTWKGGQSIPWATGDYSVFTECDGSITCSFEDTAHKRPTYFNTSSNQEINIDWLRSQQETITFNGKEYLKTDIEKAISLIKPVE